jgi:hypothetical protein
MHPSTIGIEEKTMKKILIALLALISMIALTGCTAVNNLSESVKDKNIAAGSDTWGGNIDIGLSIENGYIPRIDFWFGRRKVWYASLKKDEATTDLKDIVAASNAPLDISAGASGVNVKNNPK